MSQVNEGGTETGAAAHCASYYAATANDDARYPALRGDHRTDVCVIGAGFTGLGASAQYARARPATTAPPTTVAGPRRAGRSPDERSRRAGKSRQQPRQRHLPEGNFASKA